MKKVDRKPIEMQDSWTLVQHMGRGLRHMGATFDLVVSTPFRDHSLYVSKLLGWNVCLELITFGIQTAAVWTLCALYIRTTGDDFVAAPGTVHVTVT